MIPALLAAAAGAVAATILALVPTVHVCSVAALILSAWAAARAPFPAELLAMGMLGMTTGYAFTSIIPGTFFAIPDEGSAFIVLPAQKYLLRRRGVEAAVLTGMGGLGGIAALALLAPVAPSFLPLLQAILQPHLHWMVWAIIAYTLISEWPKGSDRAPVGLRRWWDGWKNLAAGLATFLLSGLAGLILFYRNPVSTPIAYHDLYPAFSGLFVVPWLLQNLLSRVEPPPQHIAETVEGTPGLLLRGILAGVSGGLFAAFLPAVSGGIGALIAGHATAQRDDRLFLVSQGAAKATTYAGSLLLFFVPGLHLTRGSMAWMIGSIWCATTPRTYILAVSAVILSGIVSYLMLVPMAHLAARSIGKLPYRWISAGASITLVITIAGLTGLEGLLVCAVTSGIGLIPTLWGCRRANCMGILLLPIALNMVGAASTIARWLDLL